MRFTNVKVVFSPALDKASDSVVDAVFGNFAAEFDKQNLKRALGEFAHALWTTFQSLPSKEQNDEGSVATEDASSTDDDKQKN